MPTLSRTFIKTAMLHFALALGMAALLAAQPVFDLSPRLVAFQPVYLHLLVVGWLTQLIIGVAYWMFPKYSREKPRGSVRLGWMVYVLLNAGLILRAVGEPLGVLRPETDAGWMLVGSAACQLAAGWGFIANTWPRVKGH